MHHCYYNNQHRPFSVFTVCKNFLPLLQIWERQMHTEMSRDIFCVYFLDLRGYRPICIEVNTVNKLSGVNFSIKAVAKALSKVRADKAPGPDNITSPLLREVQMVIHYPRTILFNKSVTKGSVPDDWSTANVSPLF
jgi:hypothetical protein